MNTDELPKTTNNRPELALLLILARVKLSSSHQSALRNLLATPLDWDDLLLIAAHHGLEPLLFHHLVAMGIDTVPAAAMQALREQCKLIAGRNMILAARLKEVSAHLRARGIEHIAYRGPILAETCYGNCALRVFRDLDILVQPQRLLATRDALAEIGFNDKSRLSPSQLAASFRFGFEHPFTATGGLDLDLHWRVVQRFKARSLDMPGIWSRLTMVSFWGVEVPTFSPEDLLVTLCLHAGHHGWMQISQLCDIAQLFQIHPHLNWEIVDSHLGDSNTRRIVSLSLYLLKQHWDAPIPEDRRSRISADPHVARLAARIQTEVWPSANPALTTASLRWLLDRSSGEDTADRMLLVLGSFFCPAVEDFEAFRLPMVLAPLYPGLRVLRLAYKLASSRQT